MSLHRTEQFLLKVALITNGCRSNLQGKIGIEADQKFIIMPKPRCSHRALQASSSAIAYGMGWRQLTLRAHLHILLLFRGGECGRLAFCFVVVVLWFFFSLRSLQMIY